MEHPDPGPRRARGRARPLTPTGRRWLIDGTNVVGTRPDGWWRDRPAAFARLVERLQRFADATGDEVAVVFDGRPAEDLGEGDHAGVRVLWAERRGPDAADDRIVAVLDAGGVGDREGAEVTVVTSDRGLAERVTARGARVEGAGSFLGRLDEHGS